MRIPKLLPAVCAVAFCAGFFLVRAEDNPAQAAARAALMEKMNEWDVQQPQPAQPTTPPAVVVTPSGATQEQPSQPTNAPSATKAVAVQQPKKPVVPMTKPAAPEAKPVAVPPSKPANLSYPGKELGLKPIMAPPPPVSAAKDAQLQALLEKYEANQITPDQYQAERAKILAEP
jgi:hypothetical protein